MSGSSRHSYVADRGYETWRLTAELGRWLPRPQVQQHYDPISGFVLTVRDRAWPRRCVVMSDAVGVELLAEVFFAPATWEDVALVGYDKMSRRIASSIGVVTERPLESNTFPMASVLCELLALGALDPDASWWVRAVAPFQVGRHDALPEVANLPTLSARLTDEFERATASGTAMASPSGWFVFKNELTVGAITPDLTWHYPAGSLNLNGHVGRSTDAAAQCLLTIPAA